MCCDEPKELAGFKSREEAEEAGKKAALVMRRGPLYRPFSCSAHVLNAEKGYYYAMVCNETGWAIRVYPGEFHVQFEFAEGDSVLLRYYREVTDLESALPHFILGVRREMDRIQSAILRCIDLR